MRNELPKKSLHKECGIINLDSSENSGTHWVAYVKFGNYIEYFDSYGNLKPPNEFIKYIGSDVHYNYDNIQRDHPYNCGHLCLKFLKKFWSSKNINK